MKAFNCTPHEVLIENIVAGDGCYLYDGDGKRYLDLESGVWCAALGHNNPAVNQAVCEQMAKLSHVGYRYSNDIVEQAAALVLEKVGLPEGKCVFLSSGSEAVEFAVQAAKRISGKEKPYILHLNNYFLSSYGQSSVRPAAEWLAVDAPLDDHEDWRQKIDKLPFAQIGAFVFEPGNASGLVRLPAKQFIAALAAKVQENGGLLVVDEVTTGIGRTGKWFGFAHYGLLPDIVACGKGIGNGYPVSCVAMRNELAESLLQTGFRYMQSHQNDPLGCAVICAVLSQITAGKLVEQADEQGEYFLHRLTNLAEQSGLIQEVRGRGLMLAVELAQHAPLEEIHRDLCNAGYILGLSIPNQLLRIYPPLIIERRMIDEFIFSLQTVLSKQKARP